MSSDWCGYLDLAARLAEQEDEAALRSAVSRAYYAAYHVCRLHLEEIVKGFAVTPGDDSHAKVWRELKAQPTRQCKAAATHGDRLKLQRRKADYDGNAVITVNDAKAAVAAARAAITQLDARRSPSLS